VAGATQQLLKCDFQRVCAGTAHARAHDLQHLPPSPFVASARRRA
jgi:hypothetical protein